MKRKSFFAASVFLSLSLFSCSLDKEVSSDSSFSSGESSSVPSSSNEASSSISSSEEASIPSSSGGSSSSCIACSFFRVKQVRSAEGVAEVYNVEQLLDGSLSYTPALTLQKGNSYIEPEEVAAYYQAFSSFPSNYAISKKEALKIGKDGRCYSTYYYGNYHGNYDYSASIGPWSEMNAPYYELDISTSSVNVGYNNGYRINRGTARLVILPSESSTSYLNEEGGYDSVCFYTEDHYDHFKEYLNHYQGWGEEFIGANGPLRPFPVTL